MFLFAAVELTDVFRSFSVSNFDIIIFKNGSATTITTSEYIANGASTDHAPTSGVKENFLKELVLSSAIKAQRRRRRSRVNGSFRNLGNGRTDGGLDCYFWNKLLLPTTIPSHPFLPNWEFLLTEDEKTLPKRKSKRQEKTRFRYKLYRDNESSASFANHQLSLCESTTTTTRQTGK